MNSTSSYESNILVWNFEDFSPKLVGWRKYAFTGTALVGIGLACLVQRAVYKSLKQLGARPINQMIIPSQVCMYLMYFCNM